MSFTLKCNNCGNKIIVNKDTIKDIISSSLDIDIDISDSILQLYCCMCENYIHNREK